MSNKDITPKVHLFSDIDMLDDSNIIMVINSNGDKYKVSLSQLKEFILKSLLRDIEIIKKEIDENKVTESTIVKAFSKSNSASLGVPFNVKGNVGIENKGDSGTIYSTEKEVRIKLGNSWHTIYKT